MAEPEEELQGEDGGSAKKVQKRSRRKKEKRREEEPQVLEEENQSDCVLLRGIFKLGKKSHDVLLTRTRLTWTPIVPETPTGEPCTLQPGVVLLQDVFAVKVKRRRAVGQQTGGAFLGLALFYCRRRGRKLEEDTLHLHNSSSEHTHRWYSTLKEQLQAFSSRPRYLKVFINPCSHKKEAVYIYREHVAPLFKVADVRTDITVTERRGHALSVMKECKLDEYDGVVCVGGDGSVAEVCHAMVLRAQLDADSPEKPVKPALPLGIIPAGSTDVVSCSVHGVRDPPTAAMHIVLGHLQQLDMCSFSSFGQLMRFGFSAMFGFGAQSLARAEKKRWMPSSQRREYALVKTLARLRPEDCQISFLPSNRTNRNLSEQQDQQQDQQQDPESVVAVGEESWATIQGLYLSISVMSIPCLSPVIPRGLAPNTRLANGSASLIAVGNASRSEFVKHLKRYSSSSGQQFSFSFVETHDISAVKIQLQAVAGWPEEESEEEESKTSPIIQSEGATCLWNIDGELVEMANEVLIRVHPCLVTLYGEEVDEAESAVSCSCI
ncbi:ceramide kinase-like protein isoform X1 [Takifugu flavidus]|uniref:Ceramide kinase-like protein n=1 Tax=Takifugu flavidus TaxID=433684 RepID=A0A5C6PQR6_9TELE|nr:ceramide kinase-like protein isoform X1 [Takifugu flavidus]TWW81138.1 Ceramide kinase-like protein [Takifugu flavidus]